MFERGNTSRKTTVFCGSGLTPAEDKITAKNFNLFCKNKYFS